MLSLDEYVGIRELASQGIGVSDIAKQLGIDRKTVRKYLQGNAAPPARKGREHSKRLLDVHEDYLRMRMAQGCTNGEVLLREIRERGYTGGYTMMRLFLKPLRQEQGWRPEIRWEGPPGLYAQADWGHFVAQLPDGSKMKLYVFVLTLVYSRVMYAEWTTGMDMATLERCHEHALDYLGGVPKFIVYDRLKTVVLGEDERGETRFHPAFADFAGCYGFALKATPPRWPKGKGKVENGVKYVRRNFWQGLVSMAGVDDLNNRCRKWLDEVANPRIHGTTGRVPFEMLKEEGLLPLPLAKPYPINPAVLRTVSRDCLFSYRGCQYSLPPEWAGKTVWVRPISNDRVVVSSGGQVITEQALEPVLKRTVINEAHYASLRGRARPKVITPMPRIEPSSLEVERRSLTVYQALLEVGL